MGDAVKAKRGDIAVLEIVRSGHSLFAGREESVEYAVVLVTSVTRDGAVKAITDTRWNQTIPTPLARMAVRNVSIVSKDAINVTGALEHVRTHTYPNSTTPRDYASLADVRAALRPFLTASAT